MIGEVLAQLETVIFLAQDSPDELVRVRRVSMMSPLTLEIASSFSFASFIGIVMAVPVLRKKWYEGTKTKYEADGIALTNDSTRRAAELAASRDLDARFEELERQVQDGDEPSGTDADVLDSLREAGAEGAYQTLSRRTFLGAVRAALQLPVNVDAQASTWHR